MVTLFVVATIGCERFVFGHYFSNLVLDPLYSLKIFLPRKREVCFTLIVLWLSVSLPQGTVGQSAVCDCDTSWSYSLVERIRLPATQIASSLYKHMKKNVYMLH